MGTGFLGCIIFFGFHVEFIHDSKVECFSAETEVYNSNNQ